MAAKKKASQHRPADLLHRIERLDQDLIRLANERAKLYQQWAETQEQLPQQGINLDAIEALVAKQPGPLAADLVRSLLLTLESGSRRLIRRTRVAYLGPCYSYSYLAAVRHFGPGAELIPSATIATVFDEVNRHQAQFGVVPLENSTDGRVTDTLERFVKLPVKICGEIPLRIHHYLLARCPRERIHEVYSKPQALSQCRGWLAKYLPEARLIEMTSTAAAAKLAAEKPGAAAIASRMAGEQYGLDIIEANIEDNPHNMTRFAVIGQQSPAKSKRDKTSLMFEIPHNPGALADAMAVFKRHSLNLTWIESFPMPESKNEYLFFVELEGHTSDPEVEQTLKALSKKTVRHVVLGSYPKTEPIE